jgi:hypothetical protein
MNQYILAVHSNPVPGKESEYNRWYNEEHLPAVLKVPGFKSARRYRLTQPEPSAQWQYLAIYEFDAEDPGTVISALKARSGTPDMVISEAIDMNTVSVTPWVAVSDHQVAASERGNSTGRR